MKQTLTLMGEHGSAVLSTNRKSIDNDATRELMLACEVLRTHLSQQTILFMVHYLLTRFAQEEMLAASSKIFRNGEQAVTIMSPLGELTTMSVRDFLTKLGVENAQEADLSNVFSDSNNNLDPFFMDEDEDDEDEGDQRGYRVD